MIKLWRRAIHKTHSIEYREPIPNHTLTYEPMSVEYRVEKIGDMYALPGRDIVYRSTEDGRLLVSSLYQFKKEYRLVKDG